MRHIIHHVIHHVNGGCLIVGRICEFHRTVLLGGFVQLRWLAKLAPLPLRLMRRAVEPLNMLRNALIFSVGLRPTPRTLGSSVLCLAFGVWGSAPTLKSHLVLPSIVLVLREAKAER